METLTPSRPAVYQEVPVADIRPSPHQARKDFDEESLKGLAESMKQEGLLEPIIVREANGSFELISGERRLRAAKLLGWKTIESKIIQTTSDAEAAAKGLVENLQRQDLNPIEEAEGFQTLDQLDGKYWTQERIGRIAGHSESYVSRSLDLLALPDEVIKNLRARKFSRSHGVELLRLNNVEQQLEVARQIPGRLTWEETRALVDHMLGPKKVKRAPEPPKIFPDPFAPIWKSLESRTPEGIFWKAEYKFVGHWVFEVVMPNPTQAALGEWFQLGSEALLGSLLGTVPKEPPNSSVGTVPKSGNKAKGVDEARVPSNPAEEADLLAAARQGPEAFYTWVYGKDSPWTRGVAGKSWQAVIGLSDPKEAMDAFLTGIHLAK